MEKSPATELAYVQTCIGELDPYLLSKELFWPLSGRDPGGGLFPRMTNGGILLALLQLKAAEDSQTLSGAQTHQFNKAIADFDVIKSKWRVAFETKTRRELDSRLNQWRNYLDELVEQPEAHAGYYSAEVRVRVIVQLLLESIGDPDSQSSEQIAYLDNRLRRVLKSCEFIWEPFLESRFPNNVFWYLYGKPTRLEK